MGGNMSYVDEHLNSGEEVAFRTTLHPIVFAIPAIFTAISILFAIQSATRDFAVVTFGLAIIVGIFVAIQNATSEFAVTTSRVIIKVGWLNRRTVELQLTKVEGITVEQDILGRIFDFGTIVVGGTGGTKEPFKYIRSPIEFRKSVQQQIESNDMTRGSGNLSVPANVSTGPREERECPHCAERILRRANRCRFCNQEVKPLQSAT